MQDRAKELQVGIFSEITNVVEYFVDAYFDLVHRRIDGLQKLLWNRIQSRIPWLQWLRKCILDNIRSRMFATKCQNGRHRPALILFLELSITHFSRIYWSHEHSQIYVVQF